MTIHTVSTDAQLTAAITAAVYGDEIRCQAGTTFTNTGGGSYTFPPKSGYTPGDTILVTTTASSGLPPAGWRTNPSYAALMPTFQSRQENAYQNLPAIQVSPGAKGYVFRHLRILQTYLGAGTSVRVGLQDNTQQYKKSQQPEDITFDRCYFATPNYYWGSARGIQRHGKNITCTECYFDPHSAPAQQTQCIWDLNGEGPYTVTNCHLGGGSQMYLTGGADAYLRTEATCSASPAPTTTSAFVSWAAAPHPDSDPPVVGQHVAITTANAARRHAFVTAYTPSTSNSGLMTFTRTEGSPGVPLEEVPLVGGAIGWGVIPSSITFQRNLCQNPASWLNPIIPAPSNITLTTQAGGSLTAGTYGVRVAARKALTAGTTYDSTAIGNPDATNKTITLTANQSLHIAWTAAPDADSYRAYVTLPDGTIRFVNVALPATSVVFSAATQGTATSSITTGRRWDIRNLFELKCGRDVDISANIFRQGPPGSGNGYALWIKSVNQSNAAEWNTTTNVDIHHNQIYDTLGILSTSARENESGNQANRVGQMRNMRFRHNLCYNTNGTVWAQGITDNFGVSFTGGKEYLFDHNTLIHTTKGCLRLLVQPARENFIHAPVITNNLFLRNTNGIKGQNAEPGYGTVEGTQSLQEYTHGTYTFTNNAIAGAPVASYPAGNYFPTVAAFQAWFADYAGLDFSLPPGSPAIGAGTGGSNLGADVTAVLTGTADVITGTPPLGPPPTITTTSPLPPARVNQTYSHTLTAADGDPPYTWTIASGILPVGLALAGATGVISGIPTVVGDVTFTVRVTDDNATSSTKELLLPVGVPLGPTRYYFPSTGAPDVVPLAASSGWTDKTVGAARMFAMSTTKRGSPIVISRKVAAAPNPSFTVLNQYVGPSLAAQNLGGTFKLQIRCGENSVPLNATLAVCVRVINPSGQEVAILTNGGSPVPVASEDVSTTPPEFPAIQLGLNLERNRRLRDASGLTTIPLEEYACANGDRMVVEIGYRDASTSTSASGAILIGDSGSGDLPEGDS